MLRYLIPVVFGSITLFTCNTGYREIREKHALVIKKELSEYMDTVQDFTRCLVWIPGKEGEPDIYLLHCSDAGDPSSEKRDLIVAGEKELKVICFDDLIRPEIDDTVRIPYTVIDYIEYQSRNYSDDPGQGITLYLSSHIGPDLMH